MSDNVSLDYLVAVDDRCADKRRVSVVHLNERTVVEWRHRHKGLDVFVIAASVVLYKYEELIAGKTSIVNLVGIDELITRCLQIEFQHRDDQLFVRRDDQTYRNFLSQLVAI